MRTDRLIELADFIERLPPDRFSIHKWVEVDGSDIRIAERYATLGELKHNCGTVACIGGWIEILFNPEMLPDHHRGVEIVADLLEISENKAWLLTHPTGVDWELINQPVAVAAIRHFAATGKIDWLEAVYTLGNRHNDQ